MFMAPAPPVAVAAQAPRTEFHAYRVTAAAGSERVEVAGDPAAGRPDRGAAVLGGRVLGPRGRRRQGANQARPPARAPAARPRHADGRRWARRRRAAVDKGARHLYLRAMNVEPSTPALELAAALRRRELSAVELLDACLEAVDARNGDVNAVVWRNDDAARHAARHADEALARGDDAAFLGVPIPLKELTPVAGWPVTYGSRGGPSGTSAQGELTTEAFKRAGF